MLQERMAGTKAKADKQPIVRRRRASKKRPKLNESARIHQNIHPMEINVEMRPK